jgi:hypothetical protein
MLKQIFRHDPVAGRHRISRKLEIFLIDLRRRTANTDTRAVAIKIIVTGARISPPAIITTASRPFGTLSLSHDTITLCGTNINSAFAGRTPASGF